VAVAYYLDASAAMKGYVSERGSRRVVQLLEGDAGYELYLSRIGTVEIAAAIFGKVRAGEARSGEALSAVTRLRADVDAVYRVVEVDPATADRAIEVAARHRLRVYDCLQLATALLLQEQRDALGLAPLTFASSDRELGAAARAEGLTVEDPALS
jgi:predicted nucleic acid-binding protein